MERWSSAGTLDTTPAPIQQPGRGRSLSDLANLAAASGPEKMQVTTSDDFNNPGGSGIVSPTAMEEDSLTRADLGAAQHQSYTARKMEGKVSATSLVTDSTFFNTASADPERVGTMNPPGDKEVLKTFRGVRIHRAGEQVNQYVTMSLDPGNMHCLSCEKEHTVPQGGKPVTVVLSDENFIPMWPGKSPDGCVTVIRIEGGSLTELMDIFGDVFGRNGLPEGSVLLLGSLVHLHRYGAGQYAKDWTGILMKAGRSWPTVRICPLVPVIREDVPGSVARELFELAAWFARMYTGNMQGMKECWEKLITTVIDNGVGATTLLNPESYTIVMPSTLDDKSPLLPHTYVTKSSRPLNLKGFGKGQQLELLGAISDTLGRDFMIHAGIGSTSANATERSGAKESISKIILVGASNLHRVTRQLGELGYDVINLCVPGWVATPNNVTDMVKTV